MDTHRVHRFGVSDAGVSYTASALTPTTVPEGLFGTAKTNTRKSPNSPFSTNFDCDTTTASQSDSAEQQSSTESLSGASASCNSSFESNGYCYRLSPSSLDSLQKSSFASTSGAIYAQNPNGGQSMRDALTQIETRPVGPGNEDAESRGQTMRNQDPQSSYAIRSQPVDSLSLDSEVRNQPLQEVKEETHFHGNPSGNLKQLLFECARALSDNRLSDFEQLVEQARSVVSISGDPLQRLGAYMIEGMVARKESSGTSIYHSLRCKEPLGKELLSYMHILYEICPYLKFGYMAANGAIAEACRNENIIHIVDFQIAQGTQWMTLLQALAARPGGPPHVRITGIDDPVSKYARGTSLEAVGKRLAAMSEKFNIPVEFHAVPVFAPQVTQDMLQLRPNEALAVNFPLQLHHTPDESVDVENPRDGLLRMVKSLSPKVTTLVEQESNTNTTPFLIRFAETLDYYSAMFESIDVTMARDRKERISVEQHCLAKDIVNIIACEGKERVERHELLGKWKSRFTMAGFRQYPLSSYVNSVIRGLLRCYSEHYSLVEKDGAMLLGWKNRMLISASAWH